jgi:hypothetical protein
MVAIATDDAWQETCLIAISPEGGSDVQFAGITETLDFDRGDKDIEGVTLVNGGRVVKWNPEADTTITLEAYPLEAGTDSGTEGKGFYDLMNTADASVPIRVLNDHTRTRYRVLVLWTNDPSVVTAQSATADTFSALRLGFADAYLTSVKPSFTDGILKYTVMFKLAPYDKTAAANLLEESAAGSSPTDILPAIASYTTSAKFD